MGALARRAYAPEAGWRPRGRRAGRPGDPSPGVPRPGGRRGSLPASRPAWSHGDSPTQAEPLDPRPSLTWRPPEQEGGGATSRRSSSRRRRDLIARPLRRPEPERENSSAAPARMALLFIRAREGAGHAPRTALVTPLYVKGAGHAPCVALARAPLPDVAARSERWGSRRPGSHVTGCGRPSEIPATSPRSRESPPLPSRPKGYRQPALLPLTAPFHPSLPVNGSFI